MTRTITLVRRAGARRRRGSVQPQGKDAGAAAGSAGEAVPVGVLLRIGRALGRRREGRPGAAARPAREVPGPPRRVQVELQVGGRQLRQGPRGRQAASARTGDGLADRRARDREDAPPTTWPRRRSATSGRGLPDGPLEEANHAEALLKKDPSSPLAPWFYVFIAQRQRVAFETLRAEERGRA